MKTIYQKPELTVVDINKPRLLAGSIAVGEQYNGETVLSKSGGYWIEDDDEEEDEY